MVDKYNKYIREIKEYASELNPKERSIYLANLVTAIYDSVKMYNQIIHGDASMDSPEREKIGQIRDLALKLQRWQGKDK